MIQYPTWRSNMMLIGNEVLEFIRVSAGTFMMGSDKAKDMDARDNEQPQHMVFVSEFDIGKYPITVAQFAAFVKASGYETVAERTGSAGVYDGKTWKDTQDVNWQHPHGPNSDVSQKQTHPVTCVTWDDAMAFCEWLSQTTGHGIALPSEAQWEKAARGLDGRIFPWGNDPPDDVRCNFNMTEKDTTPVMRYSPSGDSPYLACDMAGNVWEWCHDWYDEKTYEQRAISQVKDPTGSTSGNSRLVRGGSWNDSQDGVRTAFRYGAAPTVCNQVLGFRVVGSSTPQRDR